MKIIAEYGKDDLAKVYVAQMRIGNEDNEKQSKRFFVEFVESLQPPTPREKKMVIIVSTLFGCPGNCKMCDAGSDYHGKMTAEEILLQIGYIINRRFSNKQIQTDKLKIQFSRMGEPSLNPAVLDAMKKISDIHNTHALNVSLSTIAPKNSVSDEFFEKLIDIKDTYYSGGRFQLQFSVHTTDSNKRDHLMPMKKWSFKEISEYGERYLHNGDKKITLNFAPVIGYPIDPKVLKEYFDPNKFLIKITPLNPTVKANECGLSTAIDPYDRSTANILIDSLKNEGFEVILSIGEPEENKIGSNCGQYILKAMNAIDRPEDGYQLNKYKIE